MRTRLSLTIDDANMMMAACLKAAGAIGRNVSIAIVDDASGLLAFQRMDGARAHTIDIAQRKARASAMVGVPTAMIEASQKDRPAASADLVVTRGGVPAMHQGQCAGAVGVSGGRGEEDEAIAEAGLKVQQTAAGPP
ncbi:MAG: heme-binding protein [Alphaproteobacteria bacterium]